MARSFRLEDVAVPIAYEIRYRRADAPWSLVSMVVPSGAEAALAQIRRLQDLGHTVVEIHPPLPGPDAQSSATALLIAAA